MYEVEFNLTIKIAGQFCMIEKPTSFDEAINGIFPGGWVGEIQGVSGVIEPHPLIAENIVDGVETPNDPSMNTTTEVPDGFPMMGGFPLAAMMGGIMPISDIPTEPPTDITEETVEENAEDK